MVGTVRAVSHFVGLGRFDGALSRVLRGLHALATAADIHAGVVGLDQEPTAWWGPLAQLPSPSGHGLGHHQLALGAIGPASFADPSFRTPTFAHCQEGPIALGMLGSLVDAAAGRAALLSSGCFLPDKSDDALMMAMVVRAPQSRMVHRIIDALWSARAAFGVVVITPGLLIGAVDPHGLAALWLGEIDGASVMSSSEAAIVAMGGRVVRAFEPGEMLVLDRDGLLSLRPFRARPSRPCAQRVWQMASLADAPDGRDVASVRRRLALHLAETLPLGLDVVVAVDDASEFVARELADKLGLRCAPARTRDGRIIAAEVQGKRLVLVALADDGSVALSSAVRALQDAGAEAVHVRIATPRAVAQCPYGVAHVDVVEAPVATQLAAQWGIESIVWVDRVSAVQAWTASKSHLNPCTACVGGALPVPLQESTTQLQMFDDSTRSDR